MFVHKQIFRLEKCPQIHIFTKHMKVSYITIFRWAPPQYDLVRLHLITPMDFWQNPTQFFDTTAFCLTKIGDFRRQPSQSFSTLVLVDFVVLPCLFCMFQSCVLGVQSTLCNRGVIFHTFRIWQKS